MRTYCSILGVLNSDRMNVPDAPEISGMLATVVFHRYFITTLSPLPCSGFPLGFISAEKDVLSSDARISGGMPT